VGRSLIRRLHRRLGTRSSGADRVRRAAAHRARIAAALPLDLLTHAVPAGPRETLRVAVIGGGFAGLAAARALQNLQATVTLFEARPQFGGRVQSTTSFVAHRILEKGAELIGSNHPQWLTLARDLGLGLSVITEEDEYAGARLDLPVRFLGRRLTAAEVVALHRELERAADDLARRAAVVRDPYNPWMTPGAITLDSTTLESWIHGFTRDPLVRAALEFEFANDNAVATRSQSLLAVLTQIAGGGGRDFWEDTEVYRCEDGNAALAARLISLMDSRPVVIMHRPETVNGLHIDGRRVVVTSTWLDGGTARRRVTEHDYAVLAVPTTVWSSITFGGGPIPIGPIQNGPAVKYLAETRGRYWIPHGDAPSGVSDEMGMLWEGTDNQMGGGGIDLTVFAGGPHAMAVGSSPSGHFDPRIEALLPGFRGTSGLVRSEFANWPAEPFIRTGYSCPAPGQVMTLLLWMQEGIADRIFFAGEHVSPPFFGYMEGALQSGLAAAARIANAAHVAVPASVGSLAGPGVVLRRPPRAP
jgi:monoamine oxidase